VPDLALADIFRANEWALWRVILRTPGQMWPAELKVRAPSREALLAWVARTYPAWSVAIDTNDVPMIFHEERAQR
jgi:hypothetical protein